MSDISHITLPVYNPSTGTTTEVTFDIKDATARAAISGLGNALKWVGVTTTELTDGSTTTTIVIAGESHTAETGDVAQYDGEEFVFNGSSWQSLGVANLGNLAFADSVEASYTPVGTVSQPEVTKGNDTTTTVNSITSVGTLPSMTVTSETLVFDPGTLPVKSADQTVVTESGSVSVAAPTFTGTAATITSTPVTPTP